MAHFAIMSWQLELYINTSQFVILFIFIFYNSIVGGGYLNPCSSHKRNQSMSVKLQGSNMVASIDKQFFFFFNFFVLVKVLYLLAIKYKFGEDYELSKTPMYDHFALMLLP
jgi:hypothetical protein